MSERGRRIVIDLDFDRALIEALEAFQAEGMEIIARTDVREHFRRTLDHDFRRYLLLQAWSPDLALKAFRQDLDVGVILPTTFAIYELAGGETAVTASEPLSPFLWDPAPREHAPGLAALADEEAERVASVLTRLLHAARKHTSAAA